MDEAYLFCFLSRGEVYSSSQASTQIEKWSPELTEAAPSVSGAEVETAASSCHLGLLHSLLGYHGPEPIHRSQPCTLMHHGLACPCFVFWFVFWFGFVFFWGNAGSTAARSRHEKDLARHGRKKSENALDTCLWSICMGTNLHPQGQAGPPLINGFDSVPGSTREVTQRK